MDSLAIIGGIKSIEKNYEDLAKTYNYKCKMFNTKCTNFDKKIKNVNSCILFTDTVSHKLSTECCKICKKQGIKLIKANSSSINNLRISLDLLRVTES